MNVNRRPIIRFPESEITHYGPHGERSVWRRRGCCVTIDQWFERDPLFLAVSDNDLETLKNLLKSNESSVNVQNSRGESLLNTVIQQKRVNIFDYLLSLEQTDINYEDTKYGTPLIHLASNFDENFALKLIEKGADIHKTDKRGNTFLHIAASKKGINNLAIGKLIIEKGIDIDHQGSSSCTPLHIACMYKNFEWIHMLLYYGADARIYSDKDMLPLTLFTWHNPFQFSRKSDKQLAEEILFNYTFDFGDSLPLKVVFAAMCNDTPFPSSHCRILDYIAHITYDEEDLEKIANELFFIKSGNFKLFFEKFVFVVQELMENFPVLDILIKKIRLGFHYMQIKEIIETILNSEFVEEFVYFSTDDSVISVLVELYSEDELIRVTEIACIMLSYGLRVTSADLDAVYDRYGFCELFKILLHMDIETDINNSRHLLAAIFYQPQMTIENILERVMLYPDLLLYFNDSKLKEYITVEPRERKIDSSRKKLPRLSFLRNLVQKNVFESRGIPYKVGKSLVIYTCEDEVEERVKQLPHIPCLVELSRNATRKYIIERFGVKNSRQFYTVIQCLPISRTHKEIISLERMLY